MTRGLKILNIGINCSFQQRTGYKILPVVHDDHDSAGYPERDARRYDHIILVHDERTVVRVVTPMQSVFLSRIQPKKNGRE